VIFYLLPLLLLSTTTTLVSGTSPNPDNPQHHYAHNRWQTVFPDTQKVIPLFGADGPRWRLDYEDTLEEVVTKTTAVIPQNLTARVPGDVVSDLMHNGLIRDPYFDGSLWEDQDLWLGPQLQDATTTARDNHKKPFDPCQKEQTRIWTYSTDFELDTSRSSGESNYSWHLVVESLQMGAPLHWNGVLLGTITDQFLRYSLPVTAAHLQNRLQHTLSVVFDPSIETDGRFMACAGGWDWAPYTLACDAQGRRIFTRGIVAPLYLMAVDQFAIHHVVPKVYPKVYPHNNSTNKDNHDNHDLFKVLVQVHLEFPARSHQNSATQYSLVATSDFTTGPPQMVPVVPPTPNGTDQDAIVTFTMMASRDQVELWWPNGMGAQPLYQIHVGIQKQQQQQQQQNQELLMDSERRRTRSLIAGHEKSKHEEQDTNRSMMWISKRIGFRTSAIITTNETETETKNGSEHDDDDDDGTGMHGMYLRINGALVMARGANIIPADQLEGRYSFDSLDINDLTYRTVVESAAAARMNMIRVWGGGKVLPQAFYDACDEYGILVYQDQMFVEEGNHGPSQTVTIRQEIQHAVRSLASHPSIVIWNGCNECQVVMGTESEIYATFVLQIVAQEDDTRSIWPSSPSMYGWKTGVNKYDSKPNGKPLATRNPSDHKGAPKLESHGPYQRAFSKTFPGVNGVDQHFPYPSQPNKFNQAPIGPEHANVFASEFGCSVWSSFESVANTLRPEHWGLHGGAPPDKCQHLVGIENVCEGSNVMAQRNYPCDTMVEGYFGNATSLDKVGETAFQAQLYQCMMGQTLWMKGDIEMRRSENSFGILVWQLNENWPTGGWGLLEYSSTLPGQMVGGRWKPLMHLLGSTLLADVFAACGRNNNCYVRNDGVDPVNATVALEAWNIKGSRNRCSVATHVFNTSLPGGISATTRFQAPREWTSNEFDTIILRVTDAKSGSTLMADSAFLWGLPKSIPNLMTTRVSVTIHSIEASADKSSAIISLSSDALALYVVLTTQAPGRFDENAFVLRANERKVISFVSLIKGREVDMDLLTKSLRVEHLGHYFQ